MSPIERVAARSQALAILGMAGSPTKSEVRKAFRLLAFERHPDHGKGTPDEFARISDAYHLLSEIAADDPAPEPRAASVSRPSVRATETEFDCRTLDACRALFGETGKEGAQHVATRLYRKGRMLTYFVPSEPAKGLNHVALVTGELVDTRRADPKVVQVWSGDLSGNTYDVPAQLCAQVFPGARSVQIRFGTTAPR